LQAEYAAWSDALPESLRDSATAEALQEKSSISTSTASPVSDRREGLAVTESE
jgi:hypothetical protein